MIVDTYRELYEFTCRQCGHAWQRTYRVREVGDSNGGVWHHYSSEDHPTSSPIAESMCPMCKHATVSRRVQSRSRIEGLASSDADMSIASAMLSTDAAVESKATVPYTVVVGVSDSPHGLHALQWALDEARARNGSLRIVMAWERQSVGFGFTATSPVELEHEAERMAESQVAEALGNAPGVPLSVSAHQGEVGRVLVECSRDADLLVVGTPIHSAFVEALMGSTSEYCMRHASCPVVVIRDRKRK